MVPAVSTGMRQGEILGLFWEDLDQERAALSVRRTLHRDKGSKIRYGPPKEGKTRTLELDSRILSVLQEWRKKQLEERTVVAEWKETGHVFTTLEGLLVHRAVLYQSFKRLCKLGQFVEIRRGR